MRFCLKPLFTLACLFSLALHARSALADPVEMVFDGQGAVSRKWTLQQLNRDLPADWSGYNYLVLEFRATSPQRIELELHTPTKVISKRLHPFQNAPGPRCDSLKVFFRAGEWWKRSGIIDQ